MVLKAAFRNVLRNRGRTFFTLLTITGAFLMSAVAVSWELGSYNNIIMLFTGSRTGQIQVSAPGYREDPRITNTVFLDSALTTIIDTTPGVAAWTPRVFAGGLVSLISGSDGVAENSSGVFITGIDPKQENRATGFASQIVSGVDLMEPAEGIPGILLGSGLALVLEASPGDTVLVFSQGADGSMVDRFFLVRGVLESGDLEADRSTAWITLDNAWEIFALEGRVHQIAVMTSSLRQVPGVTERLRTALLGHDVAVEEWREFAESFYRAMQADAQSLWVMLVIILAVAAMGVLNTVLMSVLERKREFGLMMALGAGPGKVVSMVVVETMLKTVVSIIAGSLLTVIVVGIWSRTGVSFSQPMQFGGITITHMRPEFTPEVFLIPAVTIFLTALLVCLPPALKAAHTRPARAMRTI
jgi:ABC-type lipoprotein release transport system permease subunit